MYSFFAKIALWSYSCNFICTFQCSFYSFRKINKIPSYTLLLVRIELHEWPTKRNLSKRKYCSGIWKLLHTSRKPSGESSLKEKARGRWRRKRRRVWKAHFRDLPFADKRGEDIYTAIKRVMPIFHLILESVSTMPQKYVHPW